MDIDIGSALEKGRAAFAQGGWAEAESQFRAAWHAGLDTADIHHHLGYCARARDDLDEAGDRYADALERAPDDPHLYNNLGEVRRAQGRLAEAAALYRRGRERAPDAAPIAANLGFLLLAMRRPDLALPHLQDADRLRPGDLQVLSDMAVCLCSLNRYADAIPVYQAMYQAVPSCNDARYLEALALLALGDFENGWRRHEVRWYAQLGQSLRHAMPGPAWTGEDSLAGQTILVHAEQGHGDTIQYLRFIPRLRAMAGRVVLIVQPALKPLLAGIPDVYARGEEVPPYNHHCSFMSLPRCFRLTAGTIPAGVPYLSVPDDVAAAWRGKLGRRRKRRVGIAWTGASAVWNRSIPLERLMPLLRRQDCEFHVLQTDMEEGDRERMAQVPALIDHSRALTSFADTAAIAACMDLVITVDTALAHLAGAMGQPVWTMLPFGAEYRWRTHGATTPWYPTMRLFRQPALDDWASVLDAVQAGLDREA